MTGALPVIGPEPAAVVRQVRAEVAERLARQAQVHTQAGSPPWSPAQRAKAARELVDQVLEEQARGWLAAGQAGLDAAGEREVTRSVLDSLFGAGGLQPLLDDPLIENINATGCDRVWVRYADGRRAPASPIAGSDEELIELIRTLAARSGFDERRFDRGSPTVNVQLPDGSRLFAMMAVTARPCVAVRRHRHRSVTLEELVGLGMLDTGLADLCRALVRSRKNLIIAGATGIGKTTLLRGLASAIPAEEHIVTIEDALELGLDQGLHLRVTALQAREDNIEGAGAVDQSMLVRAALRLNPDRVIVGEVRGPEVVPMCNAMSMGTDGSMATLHASTSRGVFAKLAAYAVQGPERLGLEAVNLLVASAVHMVLHLAWSSDGVRVLSSVREVIDADGAQVVTNEVYRPGPDRRAQPASPLRADTLDQLIATGYDPGLARLPDRCWL